MQGSLEGPVVAPYSRESFQRSGIALIVLLELLFLTTLATWLTNYWMNAQAAPNASGLVPYLVSLGGTAISVLVATVIYLYSTSEARARRLAHEMTAELRRQGDELALVARELQESNGELEQFAYVASHDLREPLRMVKSYMALLDRRFGDRIDGDGKDYIHFAVDGAERMDRLVQGLLEYSRVGRQHTDVLEVDLGEQADKALANLRVAILDSGAVVKRDPLPRVEANPMRILQLFQNLIDNAIKYRSDRPAEIHIGSRPTEGGWEIFVQDNGRGIPPEQADRLFGMFQRLSAGRDIPGTGIGLALAKRIVESHGGRIWAEPVATGGTVFRFILRGAATRRDADRARRADAILVRVGYRASRVAADVPAMSGTAAHQE